MSAVDDLAQLEAWLNHAEALASAAEDAELVFDIMALKEQAGLPVSRPGGGQN